MMLQLELDPDSDDACHLHSDDACRLHSDDAWIFINQIERGHLLVRLSADIY